MWGMLLAVFSLGASPKTGNITVIVKTGGQTGGNIHLALFENAASFPKNSEAYQGIKLPASSGFTQHTFERIPWGTYALAVFHDLNGNDKLDRNFLGVPSEPYAFSNNPTVKWKEPTFEEAAFPLRQATLNISVQLKTWRNY